MSLCFNHLKIFFVLIFFKSMSATKPSGITLLMLSTSPPPVIFEHPFKILLLISFDPCQFDIAQTKQEYGQLLILVAMAFQQSHEKYPEDEP